MLGRRALVLQATICRRHYTTTPSLKPVPLLPNDSIETFRKDAFDPATPALLPAKSFAELPAIRKWFLKGPDDRMVLNDSYLNRYGSTLVPLEIMKGILFSRSEQTLSFFLEYVM